MDKTCGKNVDAFEYTAKQKLKMTTFILIGEVDIWWHSIKRNYVHNRTLLTWAIFQQEFDKKFIPPHIQGQKSTEFANLVQGNSTVVEYVSKFLELAKYAPHLVDTGEHKCEKFESSLRPAMYH